MKTSRAKRYMIEDLGAIGDFDFNDVVVDVEEYTIYTHKVTSENGVKTSDEIINTTMCKRDGLFWVFDLLQECVAANEQHSQQNGCPVHVVALVGVLELSRQQMD